MKIYFRKITYALFFTMLMFPILSYIYVQLNLPKSIGYLFIFVFFIYGIFFIINVKKIIYPKFLYLLMLYMVYVPIRAHLSGELPNRHVLTQTYYDILQTSIFLCILIIYNTKFTEKFIKKSIFVFKFTVIATIIVSINQLFDNNFFASPFFEESVFSKGIYSFRRVSIFGYISLLSFGLSFIPLLSVLIGYMLYKRDKRYIYILIIGGLAALLSNTRFIIIGFLIITFQIIIVYKIKFLGIFKYILLGFIVLVILFQALSYFGYNLQEWIDERLFAEGDVTETTRYKAIDNFVYFFPQNPIFGNGLFLSKEVKEASNAIGSFQIHVGYLAHLVSYGIVGSILLFGFWFALAKKLYKTAKKTNYWGSFFAFLTYFWAQATLVNYSIFFYGLMFALVFDKYFQDKYKTEINKIKPS